MAVSNFYELPIIELSGTPEQMGEQLGELYRNEIHDLCCIHNSWTQNIISQAGRYYSNDSLYAIMNECLTEVRKYAPSLYDEMLHCSKAAHVDVQQLCLLQMSDVIDLLAFSGLWHRFGCSSVIISPEYSESNLLLMGQTWDWLTEDMPFFCVMHRKPKSGIENWCVGTLGSYSMGMNAHGLATGATNLMTWDSQIGLLRIAITHNVLQSSSAEEAIIKITDVPRISAHYYYVGDSNGDAYGIESTATKSKVNKITSGYYPHCNHILDPELRKMEPASPDPSTLFRQQRLTDLIKANNKISISDLKTFFSDTKGGELGIRQDNTLGIYSTDGCVIFSPQTREIHACRGQADLGQWKTICLVE